MERRLKTPERLSAKERQELVGKVAVRAEWFRQQFAFLPREFREQYTPILATSSMLMHARLKKSERAHLRKVAATQTEVLKMIPKGVAGIDEVRGYLSQEAGVEQVEWQAISSSEKIPQDWKSAASDAGRISSLVSKAES
jgi:hypothetical protein